MQGVILMLALCGQLEAAQPGKPATAPAAPQHEKVADPSDAAAWALQDILLQDESHHPHLQYFWVPPWGDEKWHKISSLVVNECLSQAGMIRLPEGVGGGWLIRWDLREIAPDKEDRRRLENTLQALAHNEPYFHRELDNDHLEPVPPYAHIDGKAYNRRRFVPAPHVETAYRELERLTGRFAPLVRADDFLRRAVSTIDGGLYYHFVGFIRDGKRLNEQQIFENVGLSVDLSRKVEGDDRVAMFRSGVTGKTRAVEFIQGAVGTGRVTYDIFDDDVDPKRHAIYELLNFVNNARGKEIIFTRQNGLHGFILTDGAGALVDVAPPQLATDHNTPAPNTAQLYPPFSCIRCHGPESGVRTCRNDVAAMLGDGTRGDLDVFDDLSDKKNEREDIIDRIAGLYAGDSAKRVRTARDDYSDAVFRATRGMSATEAADEMARQYADFWYADVTPERAALELGFKVKDGDGVAMLKSVLPKREKEVVIDGVPVTFEDPTLGALKRGLSVRRQDWNRAYPEAAFRAIYERQGKGK